jgi:hypothetical protein
MVVFNFTASEGFGKKSVRESPGKKRKYPMPGNTVITSQPTISSGSEFSQSFSSEKMTLSTFASTSCSGLQVAVGNEGMEGRE